MEITIRSNATNVGLVTVIDTIHGKNATDKGNQSDIPTR